MAKPGLLDELAKNQQRIQNTISKQEAVITAEEKKNSNKGRRRKYTSKDEIKNVNGYMYEVDYIFLCKLTYTLGKTQLFTVKELIEGLNNYISLTKKDIKDMEFMGSMIMGRDPSRCVKVNIKMEKKTHDLYTKLRKGNNLTIAGFFAAVFDYYQFKYPKLKLKDDPYLDQLDLKIVAMKGKARFRSH